MEQEQVPEPKRQKIQETVFNILKTADLETTTEYTVRTIAAQQLGTLIFSFQEKQFIRHVVDSFLLSTTEQESPTLDSNKASCVHTGSGKRPGNSIAEKEQIPANQPQQESDVSLSTDRILCKLSDKRSVGIFDIQGKTFVSIRDYYEKDGKLVPSARGINLSADQWSSFRSSFPAIVEAIAMMESKIRLTTGESQPVAEVAAQGKEQHQQPLSLSPKQAGEGREQIQTSVLQSVDRQEMQCTADRKQNGDDVCNSSIITNSQVQIPIERQQIEAGVSNSDPCFAPPRQIHQTSHRTFPAQSLVPIKTIRLDGKNYCCWKHQTEFFLNQLNIAYVLSEPCPKILENRGAGIDEGVQAKRAAQKWVDDDYLCSHNILNSLSDKLFEEYSKKNYSAKELWEELRSTYDEDFRTTRSEVNKYLQFQMIDGISILEQVQELHKIADSIMASGIWIDENFHISAIIAKLPPSWKDIRARLMHEEVLSLNMLIHHIRVEEDSRNRYRNERPSNHAHGVTPKHENNARARKKDLTKKCYKCGKEGHIAKNCDRNYEASEKSNGKETETIPVVTDAKINGKKDELVAIVTGIGSNGKSDKISPNSYEYKYFNG